MKKYNPNSCCGVDCYLFDNDEEQKLRPCWGNVSVVDEITYEDGDYIWVHACEGHEPVYCDLKPYKEQNENY